jgi:hypothetical protein
LHVALAVEGVTCTGIEIAGDRHNGACQALARAEAAGLLAPGRCSFRHQDVLTADLPSAKHGGATVLFVSSTCFPHRLLNRLARRVAALPGRVTFVCFRRPPPRIAALLGTAAKVSCQTSWSRRVTMHIYRRFTESAPAANMAPPRHWDAR